MKKLCITIAIASVILVGCKDKTPNCSDPKATKILNNLIKDNLVEQRGKFEENFVKSRNIPLHFFLEHFNFRFDNIVTMERNEQLDNYGCTAEVIRLGMSDTEIESIIKSNIKEIKIASESGLNGVKEKYISKVNSSHQEEYPDQNIFVGIDGTHNDFVARLNHELALVNNGIVKLKSPRFPRCDVTEETPQSCREKYLVMIESFTSEHKKESNKKYDEISQTLLKNSINFLRYDTKTSEVDYRINPINDGKDFQIKIIDMRK